MCEWKKDQKVDEHVFQIDKHDISDHRLHFYYKEKKRHLLGVTKFDY